VHESADSEAPRGTGSLPRRWKLFLIVAAVAALLDQLSKLWARHALPGDGTPVPVITGYFDWRLSANPGSAFSLFQGGTALAVFLSAAAIVALALIAWWLQRTRDENTALIAALGLIGGGALGNLVDRVLHGEVTDFISWHYHERMWPTFNLADAFLLLGAVVLLVGVREPQGARPRSAAPE
jgi:signal peptidase II